MGKKAIKQEPISEQEMWARRNKIAAKRIQKYKTESPREYSLLLVIFREFVRAEGFRDTDETAGKILDSLGGHEDSGNTSPYMELPIEEIADWLGVPNDLTCEIPYELIGDVFCRDFMYDRQLELKDEEDIGLLIGEMLLMADEGDTTSEEARSYIDQFHPDKANWPIR